MSWISRIEKSFRKVSLLCKSADSISLPFKQLSKASPSPALSCCTSYGSNIADPRAYSIRAAGSDTTAIAFRAVFYYLMRNSAAYQKLQEEIDAATAVGVLSNPVKYNEATKLPYLTACIREAMRLWPSTALTMSRVIPREGASIAGHHLPGGYRIGINAAVEQYDEIVFGPEPEEFKPERWLERDARPMDAHMLVFGAGTRNCIGKNVSVPSTQATSMLLSLELISLTRLR